MRRPSIFLALSSELLVKSKAPIVAGLRRHLTERGNFIPGPDVQGEIARLPINLYHPASLEGFDVRIPLGRHLWSVQVYLLAAS